MNVPGVGRVFICDNLFSIASGGESKIQRAAGFRLRPFFALDIAHKFVLFI